MARRNGRKVMSEINMVPFIDIMMVLLVAFMVSAPMLTQGLKVDLPKTTSQVIPLEEDIEALIISIRAEGDYFIDLGTSREEAKDLGVIADKVGKVVSANPRIQVLIKGDRKVAYGSVVELMAGLQSAGVENVGLITDPAELDQQRN